MSKVPSGTEASGIPIRCAYTEIRQVADLKPHPENPNTHPERQLRIYAKVIRENGWRRAITVSSLSGLIIKGHGALQAAQAEGWDSVPVDVQPYLSPAEEKADLIADNFLADYSEFDQSILQGLIASLESEGVDLEFAGILPGEGLAEDNPTTAEIDTDFDLAHTCPKCGFEFDG